MNVFHFLFSFVLKKKVSSFLFSCISFKYVKLLALVSEFNCFLRSRCSMEMWCPDDTGRDSWDWVGPLAWERECFNSPARVGFALAAASAAAAVVCCMLYVVVVVSDACLDVRCV